MDYVIFFWVNWSGYDGHVCEVNDRLCYDVEVTLCYDEVVSDRLCCDVEVSDHLCYDVEVSDHLYCDEVVSVHLWYDEEETHLVYVFLYVPLVLLPFLPCLYIVFSFLSLNSHAKFTFAFLKFQHDGVIK